MNLKSLYICVRDMAKIKPELRFHDLRHNFASHLAMIGIPVTTAAKIAATGWIKCQKSYSVKTNGISTMKQVHSSS